MIGFLLHVGNFIRYFEIFQISKYFLEVLNYLKKTLQIKLLKVLNLETFFLYKSNLVT